MNWALPYIGTKHKDCWQFVRKVYDDQRKVDLPEFSSVMISNIREIIQTMEPQTRNPLWNKVEIPSELCIVAMSKGEFIHHVGVWTFQDGGKVLHSLERSPVVAHAVHQLKAQMFKRIEFYEYCDPNSGN